MIRTQPTLFASLTVALLLITGCDAGAFDVGTAGAERDDLSDASRSPRAPKKAPSVAVEPPLEPTPALSLYVDPDSHASRQAASWRSADPDAAAKMDALAARPLSVWIGDWTGDVTGTVDDVITEGGAQVRSIVVYNIPNRDCGAWSSGGVADTAAYADFIAQVAAGIEGRHTMIILEPDALALTHCLTDAQAAEREAMMSDAVDTLTAAGASVYLDAGDSNWIGATEMAATLQAAGVSRAAGFSLNVSHTELKGNEIDFANEIRAIVGTDVHYVVDTGRAGLGPTEDNQWCNPLGRATGEFPTLSTGVDGLDALLWIKPPGESDGSCNGGPSAGAWWPEYALELAELGGL